jgi:hypothetical protein
MMSEKNQVYLYTLAAFIGGGVMLIYGFKLLFWILLYAMTHPINALMALGACGVVYYTSGKSIKQ